MGDRIREATRLELMLEEASIKLSAVASILTTVSARAMLAPMIEGEREARVLAEMAKRTGCPLVAVRRLRRRPLQAGGGRAAGGVGEEVARRIA